MKTIKDYTYYLFNSNFNSDDFDPDGKEEHLDTAEKIKQKYSWKEIIEEWTTYLYKKCFTKEEVLNFCNLFIYYGGTDKYVPDPYKLSGYLLYKLNDVLDEPEIFNLIDGLIVSILEYQGLINLYDNPYYSIEKDSKIIDTKEKWLNENY